ncbi:MAG TPA: M15 family metallopeptidase [Flavobacteriales bacterium]|nr:M15 family metallopeptidase [Flavobacteriales bacterium]
MKACFYILVVLIFCGCANETQDSGSEIKNQKRSSWPTFENKVDHKSNTFQAHSQKDTGELEKRLVANGLVNIQTVVPGIHTDLRYSTTANFMKMDLYGDLERVYVQPEIAQKLKKAQEYLQEADSSLSLLIFDCVRPLSVQKAMWDTVKMPTWKKIKFLSNPAFGSVHNYGAAVDLSLCTLDGEELDMGTAYDDTASLAYPILEAQFLKTGKLTAQQVKNRQLLRSVMYRAGFFGIQTEWWHFNAMTREVAAARYKIIN